MTPKKLAAAIYALPYRQRAERLEAIPEDMRWIVKAHIENMARMKEALRGGGHEP